MTMYCTCLLNNIGLGKHDGIGNKCYNVHDYKHQSK